MRNKGIGGTGAAVIMGEGFQTPYQLWLEKLDLIDVDVQNEFVEWGNRHEETIAKKVVENHPELHFEFPGETYEHPEHDWVIGTPDGLIDNDGIWECKTTSEYAKDKYGEEETDEIPRAYIIQVQWYMFLTNRKYAIVSVLIGGNKYREYRVERNDMLIQQIFAACKSFWFDNIKAEVEPALTDRDGDVLKQRYPEDKEPLIDSTPELDELALTWKKLNAEISAKDAERELAKNKIMAILKDAAGVRGEWGSIRFAKRAGGIDYKKLVDDIGVEDDKVEQYRRDSYRSLNPYFKRG